MTKLNNFISRILILSQFCLVCLMIMFAFSQQYVSIKIASMLLIVYVLNDFIAWRVHDKIQFKLLSLCTHIINVAAFLYFLYVYKERTILIFFLVGCLITILLLEIISILTFLYSIQSKINYIANDIITNNLSKIDFIDKCGSECTIDKSYEGYWLIYIVDKDLTTLQRLRFNVSSKKHIKRTIRALIYSIEREKYNELYYDYSVNVSYYTIINKQQFDDIKKINDENSSCR